LIFLRIESDHIPEILAHDAVPPSPPLHCAWWNVILLKRKLLFAAYGREIR